MWRLRASESTARKGASRSTVCSSKSALGLHYNELLTLIPLFELCPPIRLSFLNPFGESRNTAKEGKSALFLQLHYNEVLTLILDPRTLATQLLLSIRCCTCFTGPNPSPSPFYHHLPGCPPHSLASFTHPSPSTSSTITAQVPTGSSVTVGILPSSRARVPMLQRLESTSEPLAVTQRLTNVVWLLCAQYPDVMHPCRRPVYLFCTSIVVVESDSQRVNGKE